jgi:hypothetical protein
MSGLKCLWLISASSVFACAAADPTTPAPKETERLGSTSSALGTAAPGRGCMTSVAGGGWSNGFLPQSTEALTLTFGNWPYGQDAQGHPLIDAVVGLSNGPAQRFSDLGPIVRFNANGGIDARDGDRYVGNFPYITGEPFEVQMSIDISSHRYSVWVRHNDAIGKPFELLANNLAFRSEQQAVTRLDNVGSFVDSASGNLEACSFRYEAPGQCVVSQPGSWDSRAFPLRGGHFLLEFDALPATRDGSPTLDAVIGAAQGVPNTFSSLAPIVRFRPDGKLDARNGSVYAADVDFTYANTTSYHISMDIDAAGGRYSVSVRDPNVDPCAPPTVLARDYAFRSEQAQTTAFDHLGQFVDNDAGALYVCSLNVIY